ncbi:MAG: C-terminal binding protein [Planctomycetaceae bacterium]|nr:C-terminal binding protein [Planctomycetaceae bacterium]
MTMKVLLTDRGWADFGIERKLLDEHGYELITSEKTDEDSLAELAKEVHAIGTCWAKVTRKVIENAPNCKTVVRYGIGLDNIDVERATELGMVVTNVPDYCVIEVAEHTLGFILACNRRIVQLNKMMQSGKFERMLNPPIVRLAGQTLGLVGFGRIAREVFSRAVGMGLKVIAHTPSGNNYGLDCEMVSFEELLDRSDYISLHSPLTDETQHLIGSKELKAMKPTSFLLNTSRGGLIDTEALREAIEKKEIAGAALDVFEQEPPNLEDPFWQDERMIVTPHAAFVSEESLEDLRIRATGQIIQVLQGEQPDNVINPHVYNK